MWFKHNIPPCLQRYDQFPAASIQLYSILQITFTLKTCLQNVKLILVLTKWMQTSSMILFTRENVICLSKLYYSTKLFRSIRNTLTGKSIVLNRFLTVLHRKTWFGASAKTIIQPSLFDLFASTNRFINSDLNPPWYWNSHIRQESPGRLYLSNKKPNTRAILRRCVSLNKYNVSWISDME